MQYQMREARAGEIDSFRSRMSPVVTLEASSRVIEARVGPIITLVSCSDGSHHGLDAPDVEGPAQIVDERREAELSPDIVEALHQKGALVHPLLDAAEGMLDDLATPVEDFRPRLQAGGHPVEYRLVLQTRDPATVCGAPRPKRTGRTCRRIAVIDLLQIPRLAFMVRRQRFSGRTDVHILIRIIPETDDPRCGL